MTVTETAIRDALRRLIGPELSINTVDLGVVFAVEIDEARVLIGMTMTSRFMEACHE